MICDLELCLLCKSTIMRQTHWEKRGKILSGQTHSNWITFHFISFESNSLNGTFIRYAICPQHYVASQYPTWMRLHWAGAVISTTTCMIWLEFQIHYWYEVTLVIADKSLNFQLFHLTFVFSHPFLISGNLNLFAIICAVMFITITIIVLIVILSVNRHSAKYYTNEDKRCGKRDEFTFWHFHSPNQFF